MNHRRRTSPNARLGLRAAVLGLCLVLAGAAHGQTIRFVPSETTPTEPDFSVSIAIDCGAESVKGVEVKAVFDPFVVQLVGITAGDWYAASGAAFAFYDYTGIDPDGTIHLASAVLDGSLGGDGILAVCHFTMVDFGVSPLVFQDVDVRDPANAPLVFGHSSGDRIVLDPVVGVEPTAYGSVKALFR